MRVSLGIAWYDLWMGAYYDRAKRTLYICPLPCIFEPEDEDWDTYGDID